MSATPRTDAAIASHGYDGMNVVTMCRQLERELAEAKAALGELLDDFGVPESSVFHTASMAKARALLKI